MSSRRKFLQSSAAGLAGLAAAPLAAVALPAAPAVGKPVVISTWDAGVNANKGAWKIIGPDGYALDAVEAGVMVTEAEQSCCVGLGGNPDRDGIVTLDACIMDDKFNCGAVAALGRIKHPIRVARCVMERTPHVLLVGEGAQQFTVVQDFPLEPQKLSADAEKAYHEWLKTSRYQPVINIENSGKHPTGPVGGPQNHDTIAMLALDAQSRLSGSCTTSGMGFKMRGRVSDSPIIGAGLFVDPAVGAAAATGHRRGRGAHGRGTHCGGAHAPGPLAPGRLQGSLGRIAAIKGTKAKEIQVAFIALNTQGQTGSYALQKGFNYTVSTTDTPHLLDSEFLLK
jgi:N4-(beta-N-acetylglucosaminyl)-L-asparaginase